MGFIDNEKLEILVAKLNDLYLSIGLSIEGHQIQVDEFGEPHLIVVSHVRETAYERITKDRNEQAQYNQFMAEQNEANLEQKKKGIAKAIEGGDIFAALTGDADDACSHEHQHEGLCLDCGEELE